MFRKSDSLKEIHIAMCKFQGELTPATKDAVNPFHKSKYCDLTGSWDSCRKLLHSYGLCLLQFVSTNTQGQMELITHLGHVSGEWMESDCLLPLVKQDPQSVGSVITYMRRYCMNATLGLTSEVDDDGEKAMDRGRRRENQSEDENQKEVITITNEQYREIAHMMKQCAPDHVQRINDWMKKYGIMGMANLPQEHYNMIAGGLRKNIEARLNGKS